MSSHTHNMATIRHDFSNNDIFRHLMQLTRLDEDIPTLIQLFKEQNIEICENRIQSWSTPIHKKGRPIPPIIFKAFMNLLVAINIEAQSKDINLFDLSGILEDIRDIN